jgi:hypothetical protein
MLATPPTVLCSLPLKLIVAESGKSCGSRFITICAGRRTGMGIKMVFIKAIVFLFLAALLIPAMPAGAEALPIVLTNSLPEGMSGIYYATGIKALGEQPMVFRFIGSEGLANTFPEGMKLSESGVLSGTPGLPGDYQFAVAVTRAF